MSAFLAERAVPERTRIGVNGARRLVAPFPGESQLIWSAILGILLFSALSFPARAAPAGKDEGFESRTVHGTAFNSKARPARSAVVHLFDGRTRSVQPFSRFKRRGRGKT